MSAMAVLVLILPPAWAVLIWSLNRFVVRRAPRSSNRLVFLLSAASPLLAILVWTFSWGLIRGTPLAGFSDPKVWVILLVIGLPAAALATVIAYWGSEGQTA